MSQRGETKVFVSGGSQAVRIPKAFRLSVERVSIRRAGKALIIEPLDETEWPAGFWQTLPVLQDDDWQRPEDDVPLPIEGERDLP